MKYLRERISFIKKTLRLVLSLSVLLSSMSLSVQAEEIQNLDQNFDHTAEACYFEEEDIILIDDSEAEIPAADEIIDTDFESELESEQALQDTSEIFEENFILESEILSETSEEYQLLSLLEEEVVFDETSELNSDSSYSWINPMPDYSCYKYYNSFMHVFASKDSTTCKCRSNPLTPDQVVAEISYNNGNNTYYYYSNKLEDLVKYGNSKTTASDLTYKLVNDYNYTGNANIIFSGTDVRIDLYKYKLDLGSAQILTEDEVTVTVWKSIYEGLAQNAAITSTNNEATIAGDVNIKNSTSSIRFQDRIVIKNTGNGCAIAGSSISINGKIDICSENNYALNVTSDLLLQYLDPFTDILLESGESYANINLNSKAKIRLSFPANEYILPTIPYTPYTVNVASSLDEPVILIEKINTITSNPEIRKIIKNYVFQPMNTDDNRLLAYDQNGNLVLMICDHPSLNPDGTCSSCSNPMEASVTVNGATSNYLTIEDAIGNAPDGSVIQLIQDDLSASFELDNNITLDLNGKTLRPSSGWNRVFTISASNVIITDSSPDKSGEMIGSVYLNENATLTVNAGHFVRNNDQSNFILGYIPEEPPVQLKGGTFENGFYVTGENTQVSDSYNFFDFIDPDYVYRDIGGNAIYPENEDSGSGLKDLRIYSFSPLDLSKDVEVTLNPETLIYNGENQAPKIQLSYCGQLLDTENFIITFLTDRKSVGTKTLKIESGKKGIINTISAEYEILKAPLTLVNAAAADRTYNGSKQVAVSEVWLNGVITGDDVSVQGNELTGTLASANAGEYTSLTIDYLTLTGADSANYEVVLPAAVNTSVKISTADIKNVSVTLDGTLTYNGKEQEQNVLVDQMDGMDVTYIVSGNKAVNIGNYELTVTGTGNYTGSVKVPYTISAADMKDVSVTLDGQLTYNGKEQEQKILVGQLDGRDITYTVSGNKAVNAGTHELTVTGTGNYTGSVKVPYTVSAADMKDVSVTLDGQLTYNGKEQEQKILVGHLEGRDITYTVSGNKAVNIGNYELTVTGTGNYTGSVKVPYTISCNHAEQTVTVITAPTVMNKGKELLTCTNCGTTSERDCDPLKPTIKLAVEKLPLKVKQSVRLTSLVSGLAAGDSIKSWSVNKKGKSYAILKGDRITGKKAGTVTITVTLESGMKSSFKVKVQEKSVPASSIKVDSPKITLQVGKSTKLKPIISPITFSQKVTYKSSNKKVAAVNSTTGKVVANKPGKAVITIKSGSKSVKVTVTVPVPELKGIKLSATKKTLKRGRYFTLKATLQPTGAVGKVTYRTSNSKIATVSKKGKVTAKRKGKVNIIVKAGNFAAKCRVTVK